MSSQKPYMAAILAVLALCLLACGGGGSSSKAPADSGTLTVPYGGNAPPPGAGTPVGSGTDSQRDLWRSFAILDYRYTCQRSIFGPSTFTDAVIVEVRNGSVVSRTYEQSGLPTDPQYDYWWPSIEGLFDILQNAYDANADSIQVQYDPTYGYPSWASIDPVSGLADDEHAFSATNLVVLP